MIHVPQHLLFLFALGTCVVGLSSWWWLLVTYVMWAVLGYFGFSVWYHRYFAHRAFKTHRVWEYVWGYLGMLVGRGSPINIASLHMAHHQLADKEGDPHSPIKGKLWAWVLWSEKHDFKLNMFAAKHLLRDSYMRFLDRQYMRIFWGTFIVLALIDWRFACFGLMGAGAVQYHIEGAVNTICHSPSFGRQDFPTGDNSRNIRGLFNWLTLGTGLHNNHHHAQRAYSYDQLPGDFDLAKYVVPLFIKRT